MSPTTIFLHHLTYDVRKAHHHAHIFKMLIYIFTQYLLILSFLLPDPHYLPTCPTSYSFCLFLIWISGLKPTALHAHGKQEQQQ